MRSLCCVSVILGGAFHPGNVLAVVVVWPDDKDCGGALHDCGCGFLVVCGSAGVSGGGCRWTGEQNGVVS